METAYPDGEPGRSPRSALGYDGPCRRDPALFPDAPMQGDIDNIVKHVLDALVKHIYVDDSQVERVVVQKFEPDNIFLFAAPSATLAVAIEGRKPLLYVRLSENPFEELS